MSFQLTCDHCDHVIKDSQFSEVSVAPMNQNPNDTGTGFTRNNSQEKHYHNTCFEQRTAAADSIKPEIVPQPFEGELPDTHPLVAEQGERQTRQAERERQSVENTGKE